jgi:hypothetical protein
MTTVWMELEAGCLVASCPTLENYTCVANHAGNVTRRLCGCGVSHFWLIARALHGLQSAQHECSGISPHMLMFSSWQLFSSPLGANE